MAKNIVICSDGTGNTTIKGRGTNVFKLFEAVDVNGHRTRADLRRQLAFYDDGVGTQELRWIRAFAGATGYGLSRNVKRLYRELCRVYEPGDSIYLFGFSRGAFTVRTLAGLVTDCGILSAADYRTEREFRAQTLAHVDLHISDGAVGALSQHSTNALYHIAQEALANVAKHARATRVRISFSKDDEWYGLVVEDNGRGFSPEAEKRILGHGLTNIEERARASGGEATIVSEKGKGTRVLVRIPARAEAPVR